jgi:hypothetical protein
MLKIVDCVENVNKQKPINVKIAPGFCPLGYICPFKNKIRAIKIFGYKGVQKLC